MVDRLDFRLVRRSAASDLRLQQRLAASVAWGGLGEEAEPRVAICHAIGFDDPANTDAQTVAARLRQRRELELLPVFGSRSLD